ncbi:MAG: class I SAM-dependent methyltransferase [Thiotrichales bacterium]
MDAAAQMDRQYRLQRYVYDLSRKYYLLGRDTLLAEIPLRPRETLLEVGCGTARNLIFLARAHSEARLHGLDASARMLETARGKLERRALRDRIELRQGLAESVRPRDFGLADPFDHILFPYVLSMIPDWPRALEHALSVLKPGGWLHIVDFSDQQAMPRWFRAGLLRWLAWFHVRPAPDLPDALHRLAADRGDHLELRQLAGRYALIAHYQRGSNPDDPEPELSHLS